MQNPNVQYIRTKENQFYMLYLQSGGLFCRSYTKKGWTESRFVAQGAVSFCAALEGNTLFVLYAKADGSLFLTQSPDGNHWQMQMLSQGGQILEQVQMYFRAVGDTLHLIYPLPTETAGVMELMYTAYHHGIWQKPYKLDRFVPFGRIAFFAHTLGEAHAILYYKTARNTISAREILFSPFTMGSLNPVLQTGAACVDFSVLSGERRIHFLAVLRGMFRNQVIYRYKDQEALSAPKTIWEDGSCEHCLVFEEGERLTLMWGGGGRTYRCISENGGTSFGTVEQYTAPFPAVCMKGALIGGGRPTAFECYGNKAEGGLPVLFPMTPITKQEETMPMPPKKTDEQKQQQIGELMQLLEARSDEIAAVNAKWHAQVTELTARNQALEKENEALRSALQAENAQPKLPVPIQAEKEDS